MPSGRSVTSTICGKGQLMDDKTTLAEKVELLTDYIADLKRMGDPNGTLPEAEELLRMVKQLMTVEQGAQKEQVPVFEIDILLDKADRVTAGMSKYGLIRELLDYEKKKHSPMSKMGIADELSRKKEPPKDEWFT